MNESLQARINTYEALSEIIEIKNELCSIFILDNNQREDKFSINRSFANLFEAYINVANNTYRDMKQNVKKALYQQRHLQPQ